MTTTASAAMIRQWARASGLPVGQRGRLSPDILAAYGAQQSEARPKAVVAPAPPADTGRGEPLVGTALHRIAAKPAPGASGVGRRVKARAR